MFGRERREDEREREGEVEDGESKDEPELETEGFAGGEAEAGVGRREGLRWDAVWSAPRKESQKRRTTLEVAACSLGHACARLGRVSSRRPSSGSLFLKISRRG